MVFLGLTFLFMTFVFGIMLLMAIAGYSGGKDDEAAKPDETEPKERD